MGAGGGYGWTNGDGRRLDGMVNTQYSAQMVCCEIVHLKLYKFCNWCLPSKFNKKGGKAKIW